MGIPLTHGEIASVLVPFRGQEPCYQSSGNAHSSEHHNHRRCVMFTVPCFSRKKKFLQRMTQRSCVVFKTVSIVLQEMLLDRDRFPKRSHGLLTDTMCQIRHLLRPHWNLKVTGTD